MIHEDINLRWYNFDDSEEIILDDRLDDLSVNTQGIVYTLGIPYDDEVEVQVDTTQPWRTEWLHNKYKYELYRKITSLYYSSYRDYDLWWRVNIFF